MDGDEAVFLDQQAATAAATLAFQRSIPIEDAVDIVIGRPYLTIHFCPSRVLLAVDKEAKKCIPPRLSKGIENGGVKFQPIKPPSEVLSKVSHWLRSKDPLHKCNDARGALIATAQIAIFRYPTPKNFNKEAILKAAHEEFNAARAKENITLTAPLPGHNLVPYLVGRRGRNIHTLLAQAGPGRISFGVKTVRVKGGRQHVTGLLDAILSSAWSIFFKQRAYQQLKQRQRSCHTKAQVPYEYDHEFLKYAAARKRDLDSRRKTQKSSKINRQNKRLQNGFPSSKRLRRSILRRGLEADCAELYHRYHFFSC
uniref:K Homology domain-containing protein n=1 Tax=Aureoumbra lagunensis TaxID=44058 RepID=A0A7S3JZ03_9STRA|mmetsp:Transcript_17131/g.22233  ORF Transcript_17131/g.22233 Transcript_17131/m.22233 type:complete len:311 (-) Transcript_17131:158-1090(-)|eukprot:CAMPEP_0197286192 /NCGR_PEP_ID=MMETSP0890-20130614/1667_1 /TAXON_ID=44058 ORGANISM="Aureoumbra lagunensis, Strain CCMP1510" /NCGR_SAMPLE_ID=MMETSP0890 /ASSEMBLY_ACC=CAM_ASM_000533 /LENGTH=310 /DNA_ID=CAMNT_0042754389 /DNA_START=168 /DNA_END=1100 /DNA_ORIENTATION=+